MFGATIYRLQRQYGKIGRVIHRGPLVVNPATGQQEHNEEIEAVGTVIVLPSRVVAQTFSIFRTRDHPGGAFYTQHETIALIDRGALPTTFAVDMNDRLYLPEDEHTFDISGILNLHGEQFVELGLADLGTKGVT